MTQRATVKQTEKGIVGQLSQTCRRSCAGRSRRQITVEGDLHGTVIAYRVFVCRFPATLLGSKAVRKA